KTVALGGHSKRNISTQVHTDQGRATHTAALANASPNGLSHASDEQVAGDLARHGLHVSQTTMFRNLSPSLLYEHALQYEKDTVIASSGALLAFSGAKAGRSPKDKRIVQECSTERDVWWGSTNIPLSSHSFALNKNRAVDYLNSRERLYVVDGFAGWDL